ncbi:MAG: type III glutamate--ammonia ligase [Gammaproteobacteria bacterium]
MAVDLEEAAKKRGIRYFLISFTDLFGVLRAKLVPAAAIGGMQKEGAGFAGFASWLDMTPADPDMFAVPDADTLIQLPWQPETGWLAADLWMNGEEIAASPRVMLKNQLKRAHAQNWRPMSGVECEYFFVTADGENIADARDTQEKPCYDQSALMRRYEIIREICDAMLELGWNPYQNDHEDANGQFEMNWDYADALATADRHVFFKFMVKSVAEKHGLRATFMPKPFANLTGNGCHCHMSVWDKSGKTNLFAGDDADGLSPLAYRFLGGVLHSAPALCGWFNPAVNSYKRINAPVTASGATWAPASITYGGNNRTHMVRIPAPGRFEFRLMDGAANPYLMQAGLIAAGLDGAENNRDPGAKLDINMYTDGDAAADAPKLPLNLLDALREMQKSEVLSAAFGAKTMESYVKLKMKEWNDYCRHLSGWERRRTLDC